MSVQKILNKTLSTVLQKKGNILSFLHRQESRVWTPAYAGVTILKYFGNGVLSMVLALGGLLFVHQAVYAAPMLHDAPKGSEWIMADWMFLSFMIFAGTAFVAFLIALKSGYLSNLEDAKHYILEIDEADYYTPTWAKEGESQ